MVAALKNNRISAVSSIIRTIENEVSPNVKLSTDFKFVVAGNLFHRLNAYRLGYIEYLKKGYIEENQYQLLINDLDLDEETFTIVAYHGTKEVGTITVNTQSSLPFEKIFNCDKIKNLNFKGAELTRLVIDEDYRNNKEILFGMFNFVFTYSRFIKNCSHLAIEVNPRHVKFYERILGFIPFAENANCPRVCGAPAVLLMGDLRLPLIYPENYSFLATGEELENLIKDLSNIKPLMNKEIEILARMQHQINYMDSISSAQL